MHILNDCQENTPVWPPQGVSELVAIWWPRAHEWSWSHVPLLLAFLVGMGAPSTRSELPPGKSHFLTPPRLCDLHYSVLQATFAAGSRCEILPSPGAVPLHGLPSAAQWYLGCWAHSATASKRQVSKDKVLRHAYLWQPEAEGLGTKIFYDGIAVIE